MPLHQVNCYVCQEPIIVHDWTLETLAEGGANPVCYEHRKAWEPNYRRGMSKASLKRMEVIYG